MECLFWLALSVGVCEVDEHDISSVKPAAAAADDDDDDDESICSQESSTSPTTLSFAQVIIHSVV